MCKMGLTIADVARVCHDANRAYCHGIGDDTQRLWDLAEQWQRDSAIRGVEFRIGAPADVSISAQHDAWMADKLKDGWKYGPVKDAAKKEHPCLVPFFQLPIEQQVKDALFAAIVDVLEPALEPT